MRAIDHTSAMVPDHNRAGCLMQMTYGRRVGLRAVTPTLTCCLEATVWRLCRAAVLPWGTAGAGSSCRNTSSASYGSVKSASTTLSTDSDSRRPSSVRWPVSAAMSNHPLSQTLYQPSPEPRRSAQCCTHGCRGPATLIASVSCLGEHQARLTHVRRCCSYGFCVTLP